MESFFYLLMPASSLGVCVCVCMCVCECV
jgi:hypothetical protein